MSPALARWRGLMITATQRDRSVRRRGLEPHPEEHDPKLFVALRHCAEPRTATNSDDKCAIVHRAVTVGDRSEARVDYDRALHHTLRGRATELAARLPADAVEAALLAGLNTATAEGRWADVAQLASELEGRRRARATVDLDAVRARRRNRTSSWRAGAAKSGARAARCREVDIDITSPGGARVLGQ